MQKTSVVNVYPDPADAHMTDGFDTLKAHPESAAKEALGGMIADLEKFIQTGFATKVQTVLPSSRKKDE